MQRSESVLSIGLIIVLVIIVLLQFINLGLSLTGYYLGKDAEISDSEKSDKVLIIISQPFSGQLYND